MSLPPILYKFSSVEGARGILNGRCLWTKSPLDFNDPFEVLPVFDEERKNLHISSRKEYGRRLGIPGNSDLVEGGGEEHMPVESWVDLAAIIHDHLFERIHRRFRVLCFGRKPDPNLLWSHYADCHKGVAIGFDLSKGGFPLGTFPDGIEVTYRQDRAGLTIPLDYYESALRFALNQPPKGYTSTSSGILITDAESDAIYLDCLVKILSSKQINWEYETETRILYDLNKSKNNGLRKSMDHESAFFNPEAVVEVIFGYHCPIADVNKIARIVNEHYPHAKLKYVDLHPYKYEVTIQSGDLRQIVTSHSVRQQHSFRSRTGNSH